MPKTFLANRATTPLSPAPNRLLPIAVFAALALSWMSGASAQTRPLGIALSDPTSLSALNTFGLADCDTVRSATDGFGNWLVVWSSQTTLADAFGADSDIFASQSTDNGHTWSEPISVNAGAASDSANDMDPEIQTDAMGSWLVVWSSDDSLGGTIGTDHDVLVARSMDNGATWSQPARLNTNAATDSGADDSPRIETDRAGTWVAIWTSTDGLGLPLGVDTDILFARSTDNGRAWTAPSVLNANATTDGNDASPQLATDRAGNWVAIWESQTDLSGAIGGDSDIWVAHSTDNGETWGLATVLNSNAQTDGDAEDVSPHLTTDRNGNWVAVWQSADNLGGVIGSDIDILVVRSIDNGATWTPVTPLNPNADSDADSDQCPRIVADATGRWIAVWQVGDSSARLAYSSDEGATWNRMTPLNENTAGVEGHACRPDIATDNRGRWIAVWNARPEICRTEIGPIFTEAAVLNTNATSDSKHDQTLSVAGDGAGNWVAVWDSWDDTYDPTDSEGDILVARSTDDGRTWTDPTPLTPYTAIHPAERREPCLATDRLGNWVVVWASGQDLASDIGTDKDILVSRSTDNGQTWTAPAILNANAATDSGDDEYARLAVNRRGEWVAVWTSEDDQGGTIGTDRDILFARSRDEGRTWSASVALDSGATSDTASDSMPVVAPGDAGNWVAAWHSWESLGDDLGTRNTIFFARSTDGASTWSPVAALDTAPQTDDTGVIHVDIAADAKGTWIATWMRKDGYVTPNHQEADIYFARSVDNGVTWSVPAPLNTDGDFDSLGDWNPQIATDGSGTWVAVWWCATQYSEYAPPWDLEAHMACSTDNGITWSKRAAVSTFADTLLTYDTLPGIATDGAGRWIAFWSPIEDLAGTGTDKDIFFATTILPLNERPIPTPTATPTPLPGTPTPTPVGRPVIAVQPADTCVHVSDTARFYTAAAGSAPMSFLWQRNRAPIKTTGDLHVESGDWSSTLTIESAALTDAGLYRCLATNPSGTAITREAVLSIAGLLQIVGHPYDVTVPPGGTAQFRVAVSGTPPIYYTWLRNGEPMVSVPEQGTYENVLTVSPVTGDDVGLYSCRVHGGAPPTTLTADPARLRILPTGVRPWWELMR